MKNKGYKISKEAIYNGLKSVVHKARLETLSQNPLIIFDGGHNENAINNLRQNVDGASFEVIVSSGDNRLKTIGTSEVPFFTGRPYIISSNSVRPEKFRNFMGKYAINAAVFQPMYINNNCQMYVCFYDRNESRTWE